MVTRLNAIAMVDLQRIERERYEALSRDNLVAFNSVLYNVLAYTTQFSIELVGDDEVHFDLFPVLKRLLTW